MTAPQMQIEGTTPFDGEQARKGYALNKMCFSFNEAAHRAEFRKDEEAYMAKFGLTEPQKAAIRSRQVLQLIDAGGNAYYLAKRHAQEIERGHYLRAVHETGARLTHDVKNVLQSLEER